MIINHNIAALNTHRQLGSNNTAASKNLEKLSSGLKINRAGDDAAGLAISEKMRGQIRGLDMASKNAQDGISLIQTAEGALNETHDILQRMRELATQSANDTNVVVDRDAIQEEMDQLAQEINRIADTTQFNTQDLLKGGFAGKLQIGANEDQNLSIGIRDMSATGNVLDIAKAVANTSSVEEIGTVDVNSDTAKPIDAATAVDVTGYTQSRDLDIKIEATTAGTASTKGVFEVTVNGKTATITADADGAGGAFTIDASTHGDLFKAGQSIVINAADDWTADDIQTVKVKGQTSDITGPDVSTHNLAKTAITNIDNAIKEVSAERSALGAVQNRLEHTINNLGTSAENLTAAESRIRDVDMAAEMMEFTKNNILTQAAQAMLAQANQQPQGVLQLLR